MLITNGKDEKNVTKGAYEQLYKPLGYKPIVIIEHEEIKDIKDTKDTKEAKQSEQYLEEKEIKKEKTVLQKKTPKKYKK